MKICTKCGENREFALDKSKKDGLSRYCKICINSQARAAIQKRKLGLSKRKSKYDSLNTAKYSSSLRAKYGITLQDYNSMFEKQNGCCAICERHQVELNTKLNVDHCHTTGKIRGLLCTDCNHALGKFRDNKDVLNKAIKYLEY